MTGNVLLTTDDLRRLEDECAQIERDIAALEAKKGVYQQKLAHIKDLLGLLGIDVSSRSAGNAPDVPAPAPSVEPRFPHASHRRRGVKLDDGTRVTWMGEVARILSEINGPVNYEILRSKIAEGPLSEKLRQTDKGLYGAVMKLQAKGDLIKDAGFLFSPSAYERFKSKVEAGTESVFLPPAPVNRKAPLADTVREIIGNHKEGVDGGGIISALMGNPSFADSIKRNRTGAYNVLSRLLSRGEIAKRGKLYFLVGEAGESPDEPKTGQQMWDFMSSQMK